MKIIIKLELEDIITRPYGNNIAITPPDGKIEAVIFSPEAAKELQQDLVAVLAAMEKEKVAGAQE